MNNSTNTAFDTDFTFAEQITIVQKSTKITLELDFILAENAEVVQNSTKTNSNINWHSQKMWQTFRFRRKSLSTSIACSRKILRSFAHGVYWFVHQTIQLSMTLLNDYIDELCRILSRKTRSSFECIMWRSNQNMLNVMISMKIMMIKCRSITKWRISRNWMSLHCCLSSSEIRRDVRLKQKIDVTFIIIWVLSFECSRSQKSFRILFIQKRILSSIISLSFCITDSSWVCSWKKRIKKHMIWSRRI